MRIIPQKDLGLAFLRISLSLMMLTHGFPKFQQLISGDIAFANPIGIGEAPSLFLTVIAEFVCPILIIIGYKVRWATIPIIITMLVAVFMIHLNDPIDVKEKGIMYLIGYVTIALLGPGKYSIGKN